MPFNLTTLNEPFAALKAFDWGAAPGPLAVIDAAAISAPGHRAVIQRGHFETTDGARYTAVDSGNSLDQRKSA